MAYAKFAYIYDRLMADMPYPSWMNFLRECWLRSQMQPQTLVDLGCGTGSLSLQLAQMGKQVTGIDNSTDMLAVAQEKTEELRRFSGFSRGGSVQWVEQDIREWELPQAVDCAISLCDCFNYLIEEDDIELAFRRTYNGIAPGGLFIFDMHSPNQFLDYAKTQPFIMNEQEISYIWTSEYDEARMQIEHDLVIFARDFHAQGTNLYRRIEETHIQRAYRPEWIIQKLTACGFELISLSADFTFDPPAADSERLFFVARRP